MLYEGARITRRESIISILSLAQRHSAVNRETLRDVLGTLKAHLPKDVSDQFISPLVKSTNFGNTDRSMYNNMLDGKSKLKLVSVLNSQIDLTKMQYKLC